MEALVEKYILLDSLLFKIVTTPEKETALLAIPEICAAKLLHYIIHLFAGHADIIKTYLAINNKLFIPNLILFILRSYIKGVIFASWHAMKNVLHGNYRQE